MLGTRVLWVPVPARRVGVSFCEVVWDSNGLFRSDGRALARALARAVEPQPTLAICYPTDRIGSCVSGSSAGDEGGRWQRSDGFGTSRHGSVVWVCAASLQRNRKPTLIPVTYRSLRVWLWVWRQLLRCCMRLCASVVTWAPPSPRKSRVSGPLGRHGVLVWAGYGRSINYVMLCYMNEYPEVAPR